MQRLISGDGNGPKRRNRRAGVQRGRECVEQPARFRLLAVGAGENILVDEALARLNEMRDEEGRGIERELRQRMAHIQKASLGVEGHRQAILHGYVEKLRARMQELIAAQVDPERLLQEAALLVDRSDIQEELVRLETHIKHFLGLLDEKGEVGKRLDFLLQEMQREANTLLSKTPGNEGEGLEITRLALEIKSEIEKLREQVQNIE